MKLERIDDYSWRIPRHGNMRVDGIVYASRKMLDAISKDESLTQVANVACLPGIVGASLAMPDVHSGYGFPIGGVAAFDPDEGIISPGGVGYDINCLPKYSEILDNYGSRRMISSFEESNSEVNLFSLEGERQLVATDIGLYMKRDYAGYLVSLTSESGKVLRATPEHPVLTRRGMLPLGEVAVGEEIAVCHFGGVPYEEPSSEEIVDCDGVEATFKRMFPGRGGNSFAQIRSFLENKDLLPLRSSSPQVPRLLKIIGYLLGDGTLYMESKGKRLKCVFYGEQRDLESIRADLISIGVQASPIHSRERRHVIQKEAADAKEFHAVEHSFYVSSRAFCFLMISLGVPYGKRVAVRYEIPSWIMRAPLWQQRLFLAAYFGAEMNAPATMKEHGHTFYSPVVSLNKLESLARNGERFLKQMSEMLLRFDVKTQCISISEGYVRKDDENSIRLKLILSGKYESLVNLYGKIGFEYNAYRQRLAGLAVSYLKCKERHLIFRQQVAENISAYAEDTGTYATGIFQRFKGWAPNVKFVERSMRGRSERVRVGDSFPTFEKYLANGNREIGDSGCVWDSVIASDEEKYEGSVYDFNIMHPDHNFIADGFVVSNCGVRLLRTELEAKDVKDRLGGIVDRLFSDIPTGVGSRRSDFHLSASDFDGVLSKGAGWAVESGFGLPGDLDHIEAGGSIKGADPDGVGKRARERGKSQLGTLGSGNHFVEIDVVDEVYDVHTANLMGLFAGQVTVTVHTGSRGLGHQVCSDYIDVMLKASRKYGIELPDRQLCSAPIKSDEGKGYFGAMAAAANFAFANRQILMHYVRIAFEDVLGMRPADLRFSPVYDVAHNIAKFEEHMVGGVSRRLCVHRKGATRAFPAGHPELPACYRKVGQPVLIPGDMGRYSFVLVGTEKAMSETFGSSCHGAGRLMSRHRAKKLCKGRNVERELRDKGIIVRCASLGTIAEEAPLAYKDVADVVGCVEGAGLASKVVRLKPLGVIKG